MSTPEQPKVLVEGGPVERRINRKIAVLVGLLIGIAPVLGWVGVRAFNAAGEIQDSRRQACVKANERHAQAGVFVDELVAKNPQKPKTKPEADLQSEQAKLFLEAIAPHYDCTKF